MGFNVDRHVVMGGFDAELLKKSSPSAPFVATRIKGYSSIFLFIDEGIKKEAEPMGLPPPYDSLDSLHEVLNGAGADVAFSRELVNLNLKLSGLFGGKVLSIDSNDDQTDLVIESDNGSLVRINFKTEDTEFVVEHGEIHVYPLITEFDDEIYLNPALFDGEPYIVYGRDKEETYNVNRIARASLKSFLKTEQDVVDILLEDLSHEDEEVIVRYNGDTSSQQPRARKYPDEREPLQFTEFVIDAKEHGRYGLSIDFVIEWVDEFIDSMSLIKDAYMKWVANRGNDARLIRFTVEAAAEDHAEIDALIRKTYKEEVQISSMLRAVDFDVTIKDPNTGAAVHYVL